MRIGRRSRNSAINNIDPGVRRHRPDYGLLIIASILLGVGLIVMYAISPALAAQGGDVSDNYFVSRQVIAIVLGFIAFFITARIPLSFWGRLQKPLIITALVLSLVTIALGGLGDRWIQLGAFSFQPVELVKFLLVVIGASFLAKLVQTPPNARLQQLKPLLIIFALFGFVLIVLQRDLGSTFVLISIFGTMAFMAGLPLKPLLLFGLMGLVIAAIAISSTAYRRDRFLTFIQPERDCSSTGYHACQALIAVGSGGVIGVGLGRSVQAYGYLPEAENDSIFAIYAEKFGFIGVVVLISLIGALLLRILKVMQRAPNRSAQLMCAGVFGWLAVQTIVNIGAMVGLLPLKGITLPFISYGGTSLLFVMAALGVVFQISAYSTMRKSSMSFDDERITDNEDNRYWRRDSRPRYTVTRRSI